MKLLLSIAIITFFGFPLTSFDQTVKETKTSNELTTIDEIYSPGGGTACKDVSTPCGNGSFSTNRACVDYTSADDRPGAMFLAHTIAGAMGVAACERLGQIKKATAHISED